MSKQGLTRRRFEEFMSSWRSRLERRDPFWMYRCTTTCVQIVEDLREQFTGAFEIQQGIVGGRLHTWIWHRESGKILDPTVRQFVGLEPDIDGRRRLFHKRDRQE